MKKHPAANLRFAVLATDVALFSVREGKLVVRLINVDRPPYFKNIPGLPGGLIQPDETADEAARRHIESKTGVRANILHTEQLYTFSEVERDPRGRVVAVAYLSLVPWESLTTKEREDSKDAWWAPVTEARKLAYDHDDILDTAVARLRSRVSYTTLLAKLMPKEFTLTELEECFESIIKKDLDKRNFRKKILKLGILSESAGKRASGAHRPAQLYRFTSAKVQEVALL